ncbi:MAG TPA: sigma 54-interacting transcriptional regulator [Treponemataceae bacterium]|nr:sigma 54-interacting transcriptional regulator [Treponemataceae bacterium]
MSLYTEYSLSQSATMSIVLEALHELVDYELAVVLDFDGEDTLSVHTATGPLSGPAFKEFSLSLAKRPDIRRLLEAEKPHLFAEDESHVDTYDKILDLPDAHSCMVSPLIAGGEVIGLLTLDHRSCGIFSREILNFIGVISRLIAIALQQARREADLQDVTVRLAGERNRLLSSKSDAYRSFAGESPAWKAVVDMLTLVSATSSPVLILGETGTGKEEAARLIHRLSPRSDGPFVAVNCSALPATLAESELFGHEKGAFTGAQALRKGRFELANGGTLFLDEAGDLPQEIQPKLLRVLQEGLFERVGGERSVHVDVRIVAATNADLSKAVADGRFREDLFYRLSVFPVSLPPLRERGNDVLLLAEFFARRLREEPGWENLSFSADALDMLLCREWPGNVRELKNAVERAAILTRGGEMTADHFADSAMRCVCVPASVASPGATAPGLPTDAGSPFPAGSTTPAGLPSSSIVSLAEAEREHIRAALAVSGGKIYGEDGAACLLGLKPTTLQSRMKKLGITPERV